MPYEKILQEVDSAMSDYIVAVDQLFQKWVEKVFYENPSWTMFAITAASKDSEHPEEKDFHRGVIAHVSERGIPTDLVSMPLQKLLSESEFKAWWYGPINSSLNRFLTLLDYKYTSDVFLLFTRQGGEYTMYAPEDLP